MEILPARIRIKKIKVATIHNYIRKEKITQIEK